MQNAGLWAIRAEYLSAAAQQGIAEQRERGLSARATHPTAGLTQGEWLDGSSFAVLIDGVAVLPIRGVLVNRFSWWAYSYEEMERDLALAENDPRVVRAVLDIDSPGGMVSGTDTAGAAIEAFRAVKPIAALINGFGCSAAYWVAAATGKVVATSRSEIGSIGVLKRWIDFEPMLLKDGAKLREFVAAQSPNKVLDPDSPEGRAEMQDLVDYGGAMFVADLARFRAIPESQVLSNYGQGLLFHPVEAKRRGMIDAIDLAANVIGSDVTAEPEFSTGGPDPVAVPEDTEALGMTLNPNPGSGAAVATELTVALVKASHGAIATALIDEGRAAAQADIAAAVSAERSRLTGLDEVLASAGAGAAQIVAAAKADGKTTPAEAALAVMKAGAHKPGNALAGLAVDETVAAVAKPAAPSNSAATAQTPDGWKAEYEGSAALKGEFLSAAAYVAFMKAETKNGVAK